MSNKKYGYDRDLLHRAIGKWMLMTSPVIEDGPGSNIIQFSKAVGLSNYLHKNPNKILDTTDPEVTRIIDLINGIHGRTILKSLLIRYAGENNE